MTTLPPAPSNSTFATAFISIFLVLIILALSCAKAYRNHLHNSKTKTTASHLSLRELPPLPGTISIGSDRKYNDSISHTESIFEEPIYEGVLSIY